MSEWNAKVIEEFRANNGKVGGFFADKNVLIVHNLGARSGLTRVTPLVYTKEDDRIFIFATKGGSHTHPDWYHNLKANPGVTVEIGTQSVTATAKEIVGAERDEIYGRAAAAIPQFADYQAGTDRVIPVIELLIG